MIELAHKDTRTHTEKGHKMSHYKIDETRSQLTPVEWLGVGRQIGELTNAWSHRSDIVAFVGPGAGGAAPACFVPTTAEVEVNVDVAFGYGVEPEDIDLTTRSGRYEFPRAVGAIYHEACHARYSLWDLPTARETLAPDEFEALMLLEEGRIEALGLSASPRMRVFLRSCALEIVVADAAETFADMSNTQSAGTLVGLVWARVDAGILPLSDVMELTDLIDEYLGLEVVAKLRAIAQKAQAHSNHRLFEPMYELAREWAAILRQAAEENGDAPIEGGEGEGEGGASEFVKKLLDTLYEVSENAAVSVNDALEDAEMVEKYEEVVNERAEKGKEIKGAKAVAGKVFSKGTATLDFGKSESRLIEMRPPHVTEKVAAVKVARMLEKAKYRERDMTTVRSETPAGRLRSRAIVQREALKAKGVRGVKVEPFERKVRRQTEEPKLTVGVMVDISGSMGSAMQPMATTAYVMAEAAQRVQAKTAMVYYGNSVFPTLAVGEKASLVKTYSAPDGTELFDEAFKAIDGALDLLYGSGARLLVIVSDGCYTRKETLAAQRWLKRCNDEGVAVVWLPFDDGSSARFLAGERGTVVAGKLSPTEAATQIGQACADALTRVGLRQVS